MDVDLEVMDDIFLLDVPRPMRDRNNPLERLSDREVYLRYR